MKLSELKIGDYVKTIKGAAFCGRVIGFHDLDGERPGVTVEAIHPDFAGTRHVYPVGQVEVAEPSDDARRCIQHATAKGNWQMEKDELEGELELVIEKVWLTDRKWVEHYYPSFAQAMVRRVG